MRSANPSSPVPDRHSRSRARRRAVAVVGALALAATAATACVGMASAATASGRHRPPRLKPVTTNRYQALPEQSFLIPTRAGKVAFRLVRPNVPAGTRVPVILTYTPYSVLGGSAADGLADTYVPKGYARAVADVVGTGDSGGCWDYGGIRERNSAYDLVEWLGTRDWSNGKVAMIGGSYDGTTANEAAVANPPHLAMIVPEVAISHWYGYAYFGGIRLKRGQAGPPTACSRRGRSR